MKKLLVLVIVYFIFFSMLGYLLGVGLFEVIMLFLFIAFLFTVPPFIIPLASPFLGNFEYLVIYSMPWLVYFIAKEKKTKRISPLVAGLLSSFLIFYIKLETCNHSCQTGEHFSESGLIVLMFLGHSLWLVIVNVITNRKLFRKL